MSFTDDEIRQRLRLREDSAWEFKQVDFRGNRPISPTRDDWADEITAFANASGGAILAGVSDDGQLQGLTPEQLVELDRLLAGVCIDSIKPALAVEIHHRELDGRAFVLMRVPKGASLHKHRGRSYIRTGASKRPMTTDERLRLAQSRTQGRYLWFDEQTVPATGIETLDQSLWMPLLSAAGRADPRSGLEKMRLLGLDEGGTLCATVAGVLCCSRSPDEWLPQACITATFYRGEDRASGQLDAQTITGPLPRQIAEAVAFALRNMRVGAHKDPARIDLPQYSKRALFEAITNAVVHRDYSMRGSRIRLSMFSDRIELSSPGALANSLALDELPFRQATRNEVLASILGRTSVGGIKGAEERLYIMERRGDGVPIIQKETEGLSGKSARFETLGNAELCVTLPSGPTVPTPARVQVAVGASGAPWAGASVLLLFPNDASQLATTDDSGRAAFDLHTTTLPLTVYVAGRGLRAGVRRDWQPSSGGLAVEPTPLPEGGSVIFEDGSGSVPGLVGRLSAVKDDLDRTYLYSSGITVNEGQPQPVHFAMNEDLSLVDRAGRSRSARVVDIRGKWALVEYRG